MKFAPISDSSELELLHCISTFRTTITASSKRLGLRLIWLSWVGDGKTNCCTSTLQRQNPQGGRRTSISQHLGTSAPRQTCWIAGSTVGNYQKKSCTSNISHRRRKVKNQRRMRPKEHVVQPGYGMQVSEIMGKPRQHPRHTVVGLHLSHEQRPQG